MNLNEFFPDLSKLKHLSSCAGGPSSSCENLIEYDGVQYHLVIEYNFDFPESVENKHLQRVYDLYETVMEDENYRDEEGVCGDELLADAQCQCVDIFWPFLKDHNRIGHIGKGGGDDVRSGQEQVVKMQVKTVDSGTLKVFRHDMLFKHRPDPIENTFPDVRIFQQTQVHRIEEIADEIFKVTGDGAVYFLKTVYSTPDEEVFIRELSTLKGMPRHENVISLSGVVVTEDGKIEGFMTPYVNGCSLQSVKSASAEQRNIWKREITAVILWLHSRNIVWGDAKPHNIMIESITNRPVLVDFGGGTTLGWVNRELVGTQEGDLRGLKRITEFIDSIST